jgi:hypothetical protein
VPPDSAAAKFTVLAVPEATVTEDAGVLIATVGAGVIVIAAVADTRGSSYDTAVIFTVDGEGICAGAV